MSGHRAPVDLDVWPAPRERTWGPFTYGVSGVGSGRWLRIGRRVSLNSTGATTRMWPRVMFGADEHCNRSVTFVAWPLGHVDVWWEPRWRTEECDACKADPDRAWIGDTLRATYGQEQRS